MLDLFSKMVGPEFMPYGNEVWGPEDNDAMEGVHLMYCKYNLGLKKSKPV